MLRLSIPDPSLVLLIGPSGAGKSTFASRHFSPTEIISSDRCRALITDDESDQSVSGEAFSILRHIARERLRRGRLTVIDATSLQYRSRRPLLRMARSVQVPIVAIVFNLGRDSYFSNNLARIDRPIPAAILEKQLEEFETARARLAREGYLNIYEVDTAALSEAVVERTRHSSESLSTA